MNLSLHLEPRRKSYYSGRCCTLLKNCINWQSSSNESKSLLSYCFSGISELSLDSFRLISTCRLGVAAQWLWSSQALSAQLNCLFSFAKSSKALCAIFYHLQLLWFCIHILSGKCYYRLARLEWSEKRTKGRYAVCTVNIIGAVFKVLRCDCCWKRSWNEKRERWVL